jgi:hypothetical protein
MAVERVLSNLNLISFKTEGGLQNHIDELQDGDLVFTPDNSLKGNLFDFKWTDHKLNDISWLNADIFSWQSGDVYVAAYNHLVEDIDGRTTETETVGGVTISFYRAEDGHKICLADQEANVQRLYDATGVAWYYILDTANKQFKLPRTKHVFTGLRDSVGGYVEAGLPNITGTLLHNRGDSLGLGSFVASGAFSTTSYASGTKDVNTGASNQNSEVSFNASNSSSVYGNSNTVQPKATQMYLYFYVGNFERDAIEQTAGITSEQLNNKADVNLGNIPENYDYVVASQEPTSANGYTWYRKYKSGWVEQGGETTSATSTVALPIEMADTNYHIQATPNGTGGTSYYASFGVRTSTTTVTIYGNSVGSWWQVSGMAQ